MRRVSETDLAIRKHFKGSIAATAIVGVALTLGLSFWIDLMRYEARQNDFARRAAEHAALIQESIDQSVEAVASISGFFKASEKVHRNEFKAFSAGGLSRNPGIQALEWIPRVPHQERASYEEQARHEGLAGFQFTEIGPNGNIVAARERAEYFPVFYVEPMLGNARALGFDLGSNRARRKALEHARDFRHTVASGRIRLLQEKGDQFGFLVFHPVYDSRETFAGFALGVFRIGDLIKHAMRLRKDLGLSYLILDEAGPEGERELYFHSAIPGEPQDARMAFDKGGDGLEKRIVIWLPGRTWLVTFRSIDEEAGLPVAWESLLAMAAGLALTAFVTIFLYSKTCIAEMSRAHLRALEESEATLRTVINASVGDYMAYWDVSGELRYASFMPPEDLADKVMDVLASPRPMRFEERMGDAWFDFNMNPAFSTKGELHGVVLFARDITERKQVQEQLCAVKGAVSQWGRNPPGNCRSGR